jgi:apolipoprotein N-acyltransferase
MGVYHKVHLVPFGEFVPLRDHLPFLRNYGIREVDVLPGEYHNLISIEKARIGISICFESLFPQITRNETRGGATLLFVVTNDAWFERTQAARQHLMMAKLRAVENRRYLVRAAASGISAFIDPYGRTMSELGLFEQGTLKEEVRLRSELTPYATFGDWFAYLCAGLAVLQLVRMARARRSGD